MARQSPVEAATSISVQSKESPSSLADRPFLGRLSLFYVALSFAIVFAIDRYWSANWDVEIFLHAARTFWDGGSFFDLYEKSRAAWPWPYPYPPLYAMVLAPFVWAADSLTGGPAAGWPQLVAVRVPVIGADLAIAWLIHALLLRATEERWIARLGAAVWLLNPILFYQTAVQAHQETVWLWPTLAAYKWLQERPRERVWWPMLLLVVAVTLKQSAIIYALPVGLWFLWKREWREAALFVAIFAALFGALSLPFHLYSDDFRYMVFEDVRQMPVQTQSWQVWTLALPSFLIEQTRTSFPTVRYAAVLTILSATVLSFWALQKGRSWYTVGALVTLAFVLTSQKVMAYHYPMLLPWLIVVTLGARRFGMMSVALVWTSWVLVSPYYAPWANAAHLPWYALLGTINSVFYGWLLWQVWRGERVPHVDGDSAGARDLTGWVVLLALSFALACFLYPVRILLPAALAPALALLAALYALALGAFVPTWRATAKWLGLPGQLADRGRLGAAHMAAALLLVPLFFTWFTMSAEVTAVIEKGLVEAWGLQS